MISAAELQLEAREKQIEDVLLTLRHAIAALSVCCCEESAARMTQATLLVSKAMLQLEAK